jgi:hypothetical protein
MIECAESRLIFASSHPWTSSDGSPREKGEANRDGNFKLLRSAEIDSKEYNSASLCSLAGGNPVPTRFLAQIDCFKIPAQLFLLFLLGKGCWFGVSVRRILLSSVLTVVREWQDIGNWDLPPPPPQASTVYAPPPPEPKGGGTPRLRGGVWGPQFGRPEKKTCSSLSSRGKPASST